MKFKKIFLIIIIFNSFIYGQYFPTYLGTYAPGLDFEQEGRIGVDTGSLKTFYYDNNYIVVSKAGIYKAFFNNSNISFEKLINLETEPSYSYIYKNILFINDYLSDTYIYKIEDNNVYLLQKVLEGIHILKIFCNDKYCLFLTDDYVMLVYKWQNFLLEKLLEHNFKYSDYKIIGLDQNNNLYLLTIYENIKEIVYVKDILDPNKYFYILPLKGAGGFIEEAFVKGNKIFVIANHSKYYLSIFEISKDSLNAKFLGGYDLKDFRPDYIFLNEDLSKILIYSSKYYIILDISNPQKIISSQIMEDQYKLFLKQTLLFNEKKIICTNRSKMELYEMGNTINEPFTLKDEKYFPFFVYPNKVKLHNNNLIELFLETKSFFWYKQKEDGNFEYKGKMPFPSCSNDFLPDNISYSFNYLFDFEDDKIVFLTGDHLFIKTLDGKENCIQIPYASRDNLKDKIKIYKNKLFISLYYDAILIYDISDVEEPKLIVHYPEKSSTDFYVINDKYLTLGYEIWNYKDGFFCTDDMPSFSLSLSIGYYSYRVYKDWAYFSFHPYFEYLKEGVFSILEPFFISEEGNWIKHPNLYQISVKKIFEIGYYKNYDYRDPGKYRLSDMRKIGWGFYELSNDEFIIFLTRKGYLIYKKYGTLIPEELPFGWVDFPNNGDVIETNILNVNGWAIDADGDGIKNVYASIYYIYGYSSISKSNLNYGLNRQDVAEAKKDYPEAIKSGFSGEIEIPKFYSGWMRLYVFAEDGDGNTSIIGIRDFYKKKS